MVKKISSDQKILFWVDGCSIPFARTILQKSAPKEQKWTRKEFEIISQMVFSLEEKGTIKKCTHVND